MSPFKLSRREAIETIIGGSLILAGGGLRQGGEAMAEATPPIAATPAGVAGAYRGTNEVKPLPFDPAKLKGLSEKLITSHHQNNYGGTMRRLSQIQQQIGALPSLGQPLRLRNEAQRPQDLSERDVLAALMQEIEDILGVHNAFAVIEIASIGGNAREPALDDKLRCRVERAGEVDRMASAWLIRRWIDPEAQFKFVPAKGYQPARGELRFDTFEADFTHEGDRCTFEVLIERFALNDPALHPIAEIVHDIDLKDSKFGRPETAGIDRLIAGIAMGHKDDEARLARGAAVFDDLHAYFKRKRG